MTHARAGEVRVAAPVRRGASLFIALVLLVLGRALPAAAAAQISGDGSSFAGIEFQQWESDVSQPPYNIAVNYQSSSSGQGRSDFASNNVDFAVSDIRYNTLDDPTPLPDPSTFAYIPVTAGGIAFMYNLQKEGFTQSAPPIQLSSLTACGIFTGAIPYWDDPAVKADNPGVSLPHVAIVPVVRNDPAGTNFVMAAYCIATQKALWTNFVSTYNNNPNFTAGGRTFPTDQPTSGWPIYGTITADTGSDGIANAVANANNDGYVGAVETGYAIQHHFPVVAMKNDTGAYVLPTSNAVAAALGHAAQQNDGTQQLNFTPGDAAAYNPSTYSYMLVRLTGRSADVGASVTAFANYCLTIGEQEAPNLGYATINRSLILFALDRLKAVPGYVAPTAAETAAIPAAGQNNNTNTLGGGGSSAAPSTSPGGGGSSSGGGAPAGPSSGSGSSGAGSSGVGGSSSGGTGAGRTGTGSTSGNSAVAGGTAHSGLSGSAALASVDPSASLGTTGPLGRTGIEGDLLAGSGALLLILGEASRRLAARRRRT
jgi:ABC-type phosphate transport system substrate-binding protein